MSATGFVFPLLRDPQGSCQHRGRCPPAFATWQGAGKNLLHPYHRALGRLHPVKAKPLRGCFASLDRFPAVRFRLVCYPHGDGEGSRATKSCIFTLTPWNRPNTHRRGRWIGFATCPCGLQSEVGFGAKPQSLFLFLKLLGWM